MNHLSNPNVLRRARGYALALSVLCLGLWACAPAGGGPDPELGMDVGTDVAAPVDAASDAAIETETFSADVEAPPNVVYVQASDDGEMGTGTEADPYRDLQVAIDQAPDGATLHLGLGTYSAEPQPYADPGCGNCPDHEFDGGAVATRGFLVTGKSLNLVGESRDQTVLVTNAGYGLLFDDAGESSVKTLTVTGGKRDADGRATDAGIVVRLTTLLVEDVAVIGNDDLYTGPEEDPVVGVGGIFGREGADLTIRNCIIEDNSWDGITLYRGMPGIPQTAPKASVENCRIGCTSDCVNPRGRGVGIGVTWDAQLTAVGNVVHHYWKGIGSFGTSTVEISNNVVRDQVGWGIIASGESTMVAANNVVTRNGTTGMAAWNDGVKGAFLNNIVFANGTSIDEWVGKKTGIWFNSFDGQFALHHNLAFGNADFDACFGGLPNEVPCVDIVFEGVDGNIVVDPQFVGPMDFHLAPGSAAIDAGDPALLDVDGTTSDMGVFGGPLAPAALP